MSYNDNSKWISLTQSTSLYISSLPTSKRNAYSKIIKEVDNEISKSKLVTISSSSDFVLTKEIRKRLRSLFYRSWHLISKSKVAETLVNKRYRNNIVDNDKNGRLYRISSPDIKGKCWELDFLYHLTNFLNDEDVIADVENTQNQEEDMKFFFPDDHSLSSGNPFSLPPKSSPFFAHDSKSTNAVLSTHMNQPVAISNPVPRRISIFSSITSYFATKSVSPGIAVPVISQHHSSSHTTVHSSNISPEVHASSRISPFSSTKPNSENFDRDIDSNLKASNLAEYPGFPDRAADSVSPFLGENPSQHSKNFNENSISDSSTNKSHYRTNLNNITKKEFFKQLKIIIPCFFTMPVPSKNHGIAEITESIQLYSWIMPFIIACLPAAPIQKHLRTLTPIFQLTDIPDIKTSTTTNLDVKDNILCEVSKDNSHPRDTESQKKTQVEFELNYSSHSNPSNDRNNRKSEFYSPPLSRQSQSSSPETGIYNKTMFQSWQYLGDFYVTKDPSNNSWEYRQLFICDGFLYESAPDSYSFIGYVPLSNATVIISTCYFSITSSSYSSPPKRSGLTDTQTEDSKLTQKFCSSNMNKANEQNPDSTSNANTIRRFTHGSSDGDDDWCMNTNDQSSDHNSHQINSNEKVADEFTGSIKYSVRNLPKPSIRKSSSDSDFNRIVHTVSSIQQSISHPHNSWCLKITCLIESREESDRQIFYICSPQFHSQTEYEDVESVSNGVGNKADDLVYKTSILRPKQNSLKALESCLNQACQLTEFDKYEIVRNPVDDVTLLGRGRFSEVRMAVRRDLSTEFCSFNNSAENEYFQMRSDINNNLKRNSKSQDNFSQNNTNFSYAPLNYISSDGLTQGITLHHESNQYERKNTQLLNTILSNPFSCALKLVSKEVFWTRVKLGKERTDSLVREVLSQAIVSQAGREQNKSSGIHIPICEIYGMFETVDGFALELEMMQHFNLFDRLQSLGPFPEVYVQQIIHQLVQATLLCNSVGVAHRDIKLSNITYPHPREDQYHPLTMISQTESDSLTYSQKTVSMSKMSSFKSLEDVSEVSDVRIYPQVIQNVGKNMNDIKDSNNSNYEYADRYLKIKLADFGMAGFIGKDGLLRGRCGTPGYVAPDIFNAGIHEGYHINVDIFSIGVVAFTLLSGEEPFSGNDDAELIYNNKCVIYDFNSPGWHKISQDAKDFIQAAFRSRAEERITPLQALSHPWLSNI